MSKRFISYLISLVLALASAAASAGDAAAGKAKSAACAGCHGPDGNSPSPMYPNLAGQKKDYLVKSIKAYKSGARGDATMKAMVAGLSDADIENLAAYYSSQACK